MIRLFRLGCVGLYAIGARGNPLANGAGRGVCMEKTIEDGWLSIDEIAGYPGTKRDTIYKWIDRKRMPKHKVGSLWKLKKEEIDDWVRSGIAAVPK